MKAVNLQTGQIYGTPMVIQSMIQNLVQLVSLPFPNLQSANISYKLPSQLADCTSLGPALAPMKFPVNIVQ